MTKNVEVIRKTVATGLAAGTVREASTGSVVLPVVQACAAPVKDSEPRLRRDCRGLRLIQGGKSGKIAEVSAEADVRPFEVTTLATEALVRPRPELAFYRKYTEAMLRRYVRLSTAGGRVPSLLGRELFRARVTSYRMANFDDAVIFCLDIEKCLAKLQADEQELIKRIGIQEYTQGEAAGLLGLSLRGVILKYGQALDRLTAVLLAAGMLEPLRKLAQSYETEA